MNGPFTPHPLLPPCSCRVLWLVSINCPNLEEFGYCSDEFPPTPESIWSMTNGCKHIQRLSFPPFVGRSGHVHTHTHARTHARTHAHTHARTHTHTHIYTCTHTHRCTHTHAHTHTQTHTHTHTHTHTQVHSHIHMYTHTCTHTHIIPRSSGVQSTGRAFQRQLPSNHRPQLAAAHPPHCGREGHICQWTG